MEEKIQIEDKETLLALIANAVGSTLKEMGLTKVDAKHGVFPGTTEDDQKNLTKAQRFNKWFKAVISRDPIAIQKAELVEGSSSGSYIVPPEYAAEVFAAIGKYGVARRVCRVMPVGSKTLYVPDLTAGVTVTVPGETTAYSQSEPTLAQKTLTVKAVGAISAFSRELLQDANIDLLGFLAQQHGEAIALFEDTHTFAYANTYFTPMLRLSSAAAVTSGSSSISGLSADDFQAMRRGVDEKYWPGAMYFAHPYVISYIESIKDSNGTYIVRQPANSGDVRTLWGHPLVGVSGMPSTDAASTAFVGFGDPKFCVLGIRSELELALTTEATLTSSGNLFEQNLAAVRSIERYGQVWTNEAGVSVLSTAA